MAAGELNSVLSCREWEHFLTRPFTLFGASLWHAWYDSNIHAELFGVRVNEALMIEEKPNIVARYIPKPVFGEMRSNTGALIRDSGKLMRFLDNAKSLNEDAKDVLSGEKTLSFDETADFIVELGLLTAQLPRVVLNDDFGAASAQALALSAELRKISFYPKIIDSVLLPSAQKEFGCSLEEINNSTLKQLRAGFRGRASREPFVYAVLNGEERVFRERCNFPFVETGSKIAEVFGRSVFPGKATGVARVVDLFNYKKVVFNKGDVLVSINANPTYAPLIAKAGAIVAEEGGLGSHAAILAREMKTPCVIGVRNATKLFKDGDLVEVDADNGVVRKVS